MSIQTLDVEEREELGKNKVKKIRKSGYLPAVVYGDEKEAIPIKCNQQALFKIYRNSDTKFNTIIELKISGKTDRTEKVITYDIAQDPVTDQIIHIDFLRVVDNKAIKVNIPVHLVGVAAGQKMGGIVIQGADTISIQCKGDDIKPFIEIDISPLQLGDSIRVDSVVLPDGATLLSNPYSQVVRVDTPRVDTEKEDEDEDGVAGEEGEEAASGSSDTAASDDSSATE